MPTWVMPGAGMLDWPQHLVRLKQIAYTGPVSLEPHFPLDGESLQQCKNTILQLWETV